MDKQSSTKRPRSPTEEHRTPTPAASVDPATQPSTEAPMPFKKRRGIRFEEQPTSTVVSDTNLTGAVPQSPPREQSNQPATSILSLLSSDGVLQEYFKTLPPEFDVAQAIQKIRAELENVDLAITMASSRLEVEEVEEVGSVPRCEQAGENVAAEKANQSTAEGPAEEAQPSPSSSMIRQLEQDIDTAEETTSPVLREARTEDTTSPLPREETVEARAPMDAQIAEAQTIAANSPTTPPEREFGTDDVPFAEEGIHFDFAPQEGEYAETFPQDQGGVQIEEALPIEGEGMGETQVEPTVSLEAEEVVPQPMQHHAQDNVEFGAENEATIPPLPSRRGRRLVFAEGDGGSANMQARESTLRSTQPAAPAGTSRTITVQSPRIQTFEAT